MLGEELSSLQAAGQSLVWLVNWPPKPPFRSDTAATEKNTWSVVDRVLQMFQGPGRVESSRKCVEGIRGVCESRKSSDAVLCRNIAKRCGTDGDIVRFQANCG